MATNYATWGSVVGAVIGAVVGFVAGGPAGAVGGAFKGAAIGGAVGGVVNALTAPTERQNKPSFSSSPTYGFGVRNTIDPSTPVAARYGEHLVPAHIISSHITQLSKKDQSISVLCGLGEGEIDSISDVRLDGTSIWDTVTDHQTRKNGSGKRNNFEVEHSYLYEPGFSVKVDGVAMTPISDYTINGTEAEPTIRFTHDAIPADGEKITYSATYSRMGVTVAFRTGTSDQTAIPAFQEVAQTHTLQKTITKDGGGYTYRTKRKVEDLVVHIVAPYGLIHWRKGRDSGKTSEFYSSCNIEVRTVSAAGATGDWVHILGNKQRDANDWKPNLFTLKPDNGKSYTGEFGFRAETITPRRWAIRLTDYLVNEREEKFAGWTTPSIVDVRVTKTSKDYTGDDANRFVNDLAVEHITEVTYDKLTYPYTALLGVEGIANDQISGTFPEITILGRWLKVADLSETTTKAWSDSYPWAVADMLTNDRYGLGQYFTSADLNLPSFDAWATFCETTIPRQGQTAAARYRFDGSIDTGEVAIDVLRRMCAQAQGLLVWSNGQWSIIIDYTTTPQETGFTDGSDGETANIGADSVKWSEPTDDPPNVLIGQFQNRENDWEMDTLTVEDRVSLDNGDPIVEHTVSLYGAVYPTQVAEILNYYLRSARDSRITAQWEARTVGMLYTPGDVVPVTYDPAGWSGKLFRIMAVEWTTSLRVRYVAREYQTSVYNGPLDAIRPILQRTRVEAYKTPTTIQKSYPLKAVSGLNLKELDD